MKKIFPLVLCYCACALAAEPSPAAALQQANATNAAAATQAPTVSDVMIITPKERATDLKEAFAFLKKQLSATQLTIRLNDKSRLTQVTDIDVMTGGTVIIVRQSTIQGTKYMMVKTENVASIEH